MTSLQEQSVAALIQSTLSELQHYQQRLFDVIDKNPSILSLVLLPALQTRCVLLCQNCLKRVNQLTPAVAEVLKQTVLTNLQEGESALQKMALNPSIPTEFQQLYTTVMNHFSFITTLLKSCSLSSCHFLMDVITSFCQTCPHSNVVHHNYHILLLIHSLFSASLHMRKLLMAVSSEILPSYQAHSTLVEQMSLQLYSHFRHLTADPNRAMLCNMLSETMVSFVTQWKELYKTNDILMNMNVFALASSRTNTLVNLYGENPSHIIYYQLCFGSYSFYQLLFYFILLLAKYNNYRNPNAFAGAVDFVAIHIFERIFGIAYLQRFSDKWSGDWQMWVSGTVLPEMSSVIESTYAIADIMKSSGKMEYYKTIGKTKLVFLMVVQCFWFDCVESDNLFVP